MKTRKSLLIGFFVCQLLFLLSILLSVPGCMHLLSVPGYMNWDKKSGGGMATEGITPALEESPVTIPSIPDSIKVFEQVDTLPEFPGGLDAMRKWIQETINYPPGGSNDLQGRVIITVIVEKDGSLTNLEIVRGVDPSLDKEALRVVRAMPKWKPGIHQNKIVRVRCTVPVTFILAN